MLSIRNLTHTYPNGVRALRDVNLDIPKGMFGLLGPNGAGKSSLMRTIATLQQPTSGRVHFGDIDVLSQPDALRRVLGYLPQDFGVYPRGSALEILDHLAVLKGLIDRTERKQVVEGLLAETNLYNDRKKRLATFSGGMRQRFGIAQALIGNPRIVVVDEPTSGLDPAERNRFHDLLAEIGEEVVVILSTHIVEDVANLCAQMAIMSEGGIVAQGAPSELQNRLMGRVWEKRIAKPELQVCKRAHQVISSRLAGGHMVVRVNAETKPDSGFEPVPPDLADVYFSAIHASRTHAEQTAVSA